MDNILDNNNVISILTILIMIYIASIKPELPSYIKVLFNNCIFKVLILLFILVRGNKNPIFCLTIAIAFIITLILLNQQKAKESFTQTNNL